MISRVFSISYIDLCFFQTLGPSSLISFAIYHHIQYISLLLLSFPILSLSIFLHTRSDNNKKKKMERTNTHPSTPLGKEAVPSQFSRCYNQWPCHATLVLHVTLTWVCACPFFLLSNVAVRLGEEKRRGSWDLVNVFLSSSPGPSSSEEEKKTSFQPLYAYIPKCSSYLFFLFIRSLVKWSPNSKEVGSFPPRSSCGRYVLLLANPLRMKATRREWRNATE